MTTTNGHSTSRFGGIIDPVLLNQRQQLVDNQNRFQREFLNQLIDPRRSVEQEAGLPEMNATIDAHFYRELFDRDAIANRAIKVMSEECFQVQPKLYELEEGDKDTPFEKAVKGLSRTLGRDGKSWHKDEEGSIVNEMLKRAAMLSRIGRFGVILLGVNDGRNLQEPVAGVVTINSKGDQDQIVKSPFSNGWHDSPPVDAQGVILNKLKFEEARWSQQASFVAPTDDSVLNIGSAPVANLRQRPPEWKEHRIVSEVDYTPSQHELMTVANTRLIANQLGQGRRPTVNGELTINAAKGKVTMERGPGGMKGQGGPPFSSGAATAGLPYSSAPLPGSQQASGGGKVGGGHIQGTDTQYAAGAPGVTKGTTFGKSQLGGGQPTLADSDSMYRSSPTATSPRRSSNPQADKSNSWMEHGLGMPPAALSGTDQQYFGVQYGPSEMLADEPVKEGLRLVFLRAFSEDMVQIVRYEWNIFNPRFGLPVMYRITLNDPRDSAGGGIGLPLATVFVHWSRVVHIALERNSSEIFAPPELQSILNNILGLHKLYAADPEMGYKGSFPGYSFETHPQMGGDVIIDVPSLLQNYQRYLNGLERGMVTSGMTMKSLSPQVSDMTSKFAAQIEAICIKKAQPVRVFKGSERGELASGQDDEKWNDVVKSYQHTELTPHLIVPFYDRLIQLGILPEPGQGKSTPKKSPTGNANVPPQFAKGKGKPPGDDAKSRPVPDDNDDSSQEDDEDDEPGYAVEWPSLDSQSATDKATIALTKTQAIVAYAGGGEPVMPRQYWLTHVMGFDDEEAQAIMDDAEEQQQQQQDDAADLAKQHDLEPQGVDPKTGQVTGFAPKPLPPPPGIGQPGGPPVPPQKLGAGQSLVHPQTGKTIAKGPPAPKPPTPGGK